MSWRGLENRKTRGAVNRSVTGSPEAADQENEDAHRYCTLSFVDDGAAPYTIITITSHRVDPAGRRTAPRSRHRDALECVDVHRPWVSIKPRGRLGSRSSARTASAFMGRTMKKGPWESRLGLHEKETGDGFASRGSSAAIAMHPRL